MEPVPCDTKALTDQEALVNRSNDSEDNNSEDKNSEDDSFVGAEDEGDEDDIGNRWNDDSADHHFGDADGNRALSQEPSVAQPGGLSSDHQIGHPTPADPTDTQTTPYDDLTPDAIGDALESAGWEPNGSLVALNSFENRVYQAGLYDESFIVTKFYRPKRWSTAQINEEHAFTRELLEAELSVVAPLSIDGTSLFEHGGFQFAVFPRQGGHPPEIESEHNLAIMGRTLGRLHAVGRATQHNLRPSLDWQRMAKHSRNWLLTSQFIPAELLPAYESVTGHLLAGIEQIMTRPFQSIRLHGDCHLGNVLWRDDIPHFVDFDDTVMGPAVQDLWMLLSGDRDERSRQLQVLIEAYETFVPFDASELSLIEALRTMRMMHHAAWIGRRWNDPAFPPAFPWFNGGRYWSDHILSLREQLSALEEPPLAL